MKEINKNLNTLYRKKEKLNAKKVIIDEELNEINKSISKYEKAKLEVEKHQQKIMSIMENLTGDSVELDKKDDVKSSIS